MRGSTSADSSPEVYPEIGRLITFNAQSPLATFTQHPPKIDLITGSARTSSVGSLSTRLLDPYYPNSVAGEQLSALRDFVDSSKSVILSQEEGALLAQEGLLIARSSEVGEAGLANIVKMSSSGSRSSSLITMGTRSTFSKIARSVIGRFRSGRRKGEATEPVSPYCPWDPWDLIFGDKDKSRKKRGITTFLLVGAAFYYLERGVYSGIESTVKEAGIHNQNKALLPRAIGLHRRLASLRIFITSGRISST
ncbi:hypothetical protein QAD02_022099 [Eretmocerus hayati]|uniref:Uncharacterized protein n=1 Tax=Eretmocerus hayati TaxID=131215 RepID=A0ACC2PRR8_9HYME|nr:hypothetical protein QAD02_022099 [Eretmocerus hayati]